MMFVFDDCWLGVVTGNVKGITFFCLSLSKYILTNDSENVNFQVVDGGVVVIKEIFILDFILIC